MTYRHITATGDPFAIGVAIGRAGAQAFHSVVRNLPRFHALQPWLDSERLAEIEAASRRHFPEIMREVDGIAEGAAAEFREIFLWNCRGDLPRAAGFTGAQGCTDIMIPADPASALPAVIGHNEDDSPMLAGHCFVATVKPQAGLAFASFCVPGQVPGHTFAVNQAGLVQSINNIRPHDLKAGIGRHIIARAVLNCESLAEARSLLERTDRAAGFHHNLGQTEDLALWSVEAPASGCEVLDVETPHVHANHLVSPQFASIEQDVTMSSRDRQSRASDLVRSGAVGRDPLRVLADAGGGGLPICRRDRGGPDSGYTLATAVFELSRDGVAWRVYDDLSAPPVLEGRQEDVVRAAGRDDGETPAKVMSLAQTD